MFLERILFYILTCDLVKKADEPPGIRDLGITRSLDWFVLVFSTIVLPTLNK